MPKQPKQVVPVRLTLEQRQRIAEVVSKSQYLDESKFIRLAIDFMLAQPFSVGEVMQLLEQNI